MLFHAPKWKIFFEHLFHFFIMPPRKSDVTPLYVETSSFSGENERPMHFESSWSYLCASVIFDSPCVLQLIISFVIGTNTKPQPVLGIVILYGLANSFFIALSLANSKRSLNNLKSVRFKFSKFSDNVVIILWCFISSHAVSICSYYISKIPFLSIVSQSCEIFFVFNTGFYWKITIKKMPYKSIFW